MGHRVLPLSVLPSFHPSGFGFHSFSFHTCIFANQILYIGSSREYAGWVRIWARSNKFREGRKLPHAWMIPKRWLAIIMLFIINILKCYKNEHSFEICNGLYLLNCHVKFLGDAISRSRENDVAFFCNIPDISELKLSLPFWNMEDQMWRCKYVRLAEE